MKKIGLLGATGSIGSQTLQILREQPAWQLSFLSIHKSLDKLPALIEEFRPNYVLITDEETFRQAGALPVPVYGPQDFVRVLEQAEVDVLLNAIVGTSGLSATYHWVKWGRDLALANKESLVSAGKLITDLTKQSGARLLPVDSEHSAIWQSLQGNDPRSVSRILLTASGGAFRDRSYQEIRSLKARDALRHPNWSMGQKITIDSATLINKGLEVMEAKWLFDVALDQIEVLIHKESIIHSMVEYHDGAIMAQLGVPDMKLPIQYALSYPERLETDWPRLDWSHIKSLNFDKPDLQRFPGLSLCYDAMKQGGSMPLVLNVANEHFVAQYLQDKIGFYDITEGISETMSRHRLIQDPSVEDLLNLEKDLRKRLQSQ